MQTKANAAIRKYMTDGIRYVCETFRKRAPGTQSERDAQAFFKKELEGYADEVIMEDFTLHPGAFMGFIPVAALFAIAAIAIYWLAPESLVWNIVGVVLPLLSVLMFLIEFLGYREMVDIFFPKKVSRNVYAVRKPAGETKRRIIFGGHTDAAYEWTYSWYGGIYTLAPVIGGAVVSIFIVLGINLAKLIVRLSTGTAPANEGIWSVLGIICICLIPFAIAIMFFINYRIIVDGANDNLSANYISMAVIKQMQEAGFRFENTEVGCLLSGSEEAGLRGAKAFAKKHKKELSDVETVFISLDTMREFEQLMVYTRGCTGTVKDDDAVGDLLQEAGKNCGVDLPIAGLYPGAVDAEAFSMHGLRACGFCGVNHNPKTYYHTRMDTPDNIDEDCIAISLDICTEAARLYDEKGGMAQYDAARASKKK